MLHACLLSTLGEQVIWSPLVNKLINYPWLHKGWCFTQSGVQLLRVTRAALLLFILVVQLAVELPLGLHCHRQWLPFPLPPWLQLGGRCANKFRTRRHLRTLCTDGWPNPRAVTGSTVSYQAGWGRLSQQGGQNQEVGLQILAYATPIPSTCTHADRPGPAGASQSIPAAALLMLGVHQPQCGLSEPALRTPFGTVLLHVWVHATALLAACAVRSGLFRLLHPTGT